MLTANDHMEKVSLGMSELYKELADVFAEESENDKTFIGFSDGELRDYNFKDSESDCDGKSTEQVSLGSPNKATNLGFSLRIALRPPSSPTSSEDEDMWGVKMKKPVRTVSTVKLEVEDLPKTTQRNPPSHCKSDSDSDDSFLEKRAMNIQANKAMLIQLMADLQKMPGDVMKNTRNNRKKDPCSARAPNSSEPRRNPERSRRVTRSMGADDLSAAEGTCELEMSLEEELMKVQARPQRRHSLRPNQGKPHAVRPVKEITEEELQLIATSMTEKIYNRVTGSTCHQCRQKTLDTKTCCRNENCRGIQGQFCGPCLRNRYGEDVKTALLDPVVADYLP
ncbi:hypothetical protein NFI96_032650 [Prochilodus magdalenae]|nr:hypothetical protein NFI96_032650 [Prochilodus magdalenae]